MVRTTQKKRVIHIIKRHAGSSKCSVCENARKVRRKNTSVKQHRKKIFGEY